MHSGVSGNYKIDACTVFAIFSAKGPGENGKHSIYNLKEKRGNCARIDCATTRMGLRHSLIPNGVQLYKTGEKH